MKGGRQAGAAAEAQALAYLQRHKLTLLAKNYHCRHGEIDLIMQDGAHIVFIEVRRRASHTAAATSIDEHKQRRLAATAAHYLSNDDAHLTCRFDAILIDDSTDIQWLKNAFDADSG